jgi:hypothetical protein
LSLLCRDPAFINEFITKSGCDFLSVPGGSPIERKLLLAELLGF